MENAMIHVDEHSVEVLVEKILAGETVYGHLSEKDKLKKVTDAIEQKREEEHDEDLYYREEIDYKKDQIKISLEM